MANVHAHSRVVSFEILPLSGAVIAFGFALFPFSTIIPSTKALMTRIVASKMAVLDESLVFVAACDEEDSLVITHFH